MEFLNENTWIATVGFSPMQPNVINFKFIVHASNGEPIVECSSTGNLCWPERVVLQSTVFGIVLISRDLNTVNY